jgi:hypothetical protein
MKRLLNLHREELRLSGWFWPACLHGQNVLSATIRAGRACRYMYLPTNYVIVVYLDTSVLLSLESGLSLESARYRRNPSCLMTPYHICSTCTSGICTSN